MSELRGFTSQKYFLQAMKLYFAFSIFIFNPFNPMSDCFQITFFETQTDDRLCYCSSIINNDQQLCNTGCFVHSSKGSAVRSNEGTSWQLLKCLQPSWGSINALSLHFWRPERSARPSTLEVQTPEEPPETAVHRWRSESNHIQQKLTIHQKPGGKIQITSSRMKTSTDCASLLKIMMKIFVDDFLFYDKDVMMLISLNTNCDYINMQYH